MVPETLTELRVESIFRIWLVPSNGASDLDGLRASQLWDNHACRSERQDSRRHVFCVMVLADGDAELSVVSELLLQEVVSDWAKDRPLSQDLFE